MVSTIRMNAVRSMMRFVATMAAKLQGRIVSGYRYRPAPPAFLLVESHPLHRGYIPNSLRLPHLGATPPEEAALARAGRSVGFAGCPDCPCRPSSSNGWGTMPTLIVALGFTSIDRLAIDAAAFPPHHGTVDDCQSFAGQDGQRQPGLAWKISGFLEADRERTTATGKRGRMA